MLSERIIEDHQSVADVVEVWVKDSLNRLMFADIPQKYAMLSSQQVKHCANLSCFHSLHLQSRFAVCVAQQSCYLSS